MAQLATATLAVAEGDETAIVMTRSFASQTALLMRLGARLGEAGFAAALDALPARWAELGPFIERAFELAATDPVASRGAGRRRCLRPGQRGRPQG